VGWERGLVTNPAALFRVLQEGKQVTADGSAQVRAGGCRAASQRCLAAEGWWGWEGWWEQPEQRSWVPWRQGEAAGQTLRESPRPKCPKCPSLHSQLWGGTEGAVLNI